MPSDVGELFVGGRDHADMAWVRVLLGCSLRSQLKSWVRVLLGCRCESCMLSIWSHPQQNAHLSNLLPVGLPNKSLTSMRLQRASLRLRPNKKLTYDGSCASSGAQQPQQSSHLPQRPPPCGEAFLIALRSTCGPPTFFSPRTVR